MFKRVVSLALSLVAVVSLCACSANTDTKSEEEVNQEYVKIIQDAATKLNSTYNDYIISNTLNAPDGDTEYIEVIHGGDSYTEYSVDSDNNLGTLTYGSSESISYTLADWYTSDGNYYLFGADDDGNSVTYSLPSNYSYVSDRAFLYVNDFLANAISVTAYDDITLDLGDGDEAFTTYKIKVKNDVLKEILGSGSYGIYKSIEDASDSDDNMKKLCSYYLEDLEMSLTFSDANVIVGIDSDGILKYICLETGGLGTRLYLTKAVVATKNSNVRDTPDFTSAVQFSSTLQDLADFVASYDTYDDALSALNSYSYDTTDTILEDVTEADDSVINSSVDENAIVEESTETTAE